MFDLKPTRNINIVLRISRPPYVGFFCEEFENKISI